MQNKINENNYELVFFNLIEGVYSKEESEKILNDIENNTFLAFEWSNWSKTKLKDDDALYFENNFKDFFEDIKNEATIYNKEEKRKVVPLFYRIATVAACLFLVLLFLTTNKTIKPVAIEPIEHPTNIQKNKAVDTNTIINDNKVIAEDIVIVDAKVETKLPIVQPVNLKVKYIAPINNIAPETIVATIKEEPIAPNQLPETNDVDSSIKREIKNVINNIDNIKLLALEKEDIPTIKIEKNKAPKRELKFSVQKTNLPPQILLTSVAELQERNITLASLLKDKRVLIVRNDAGVFLRLENEKEDIYIALNVYE